MAFDAGAVVGKLKMDISDFKSSLSTAQAETTSGTNKINSEMGKIDKKVTESGTFWTKWGGIIKTVVSVYAIKYIKDFGAEIIKLASDANETQNKMQVVFGESAKMIDELSKNSAKMTGASRQEYQAMAADIGNLLLPMGYAQDEAAKMSAEMVQLAADLGSFNNVGTADALEAIRSGLVGQSEPLRQFGVNISVARIEEEALRMGLISAGEAMDANAKAAATMSLIMKDTAVAQGDFMNTSNGLANSTKILQAEWANFKAELGEKFLPIALKVVEFLTYLVENVFPKVQNAVQAVKDKFSGDFSAIQSIVSDFTNWFKTELLPTFQSVFATVSFLISEFKILWESDWNGIREVLSSIWDAMSTTVSSFINTILASIRLVMAILRGDWSGAWTEIKNIVYIQLDFIKAMANSFWESLKFIFNAGASLVSSAWSSMWEGMKGVVFDIWESIKKTIADSMNWFIDRLNSLIKKANSVIGILPGVGGDTIPTLDYVALAQGGIVNKPTMAMIGEGGEPEAVIPLSKLSNLTSGSGGPVFNFYDSTITSEEAAREALEKAFSSFRPNLAI